VLRIVEFRKAILAGVAGAAVWELVLRLLIFAGAPLFDIVRALGLLSFPHGQAVEWWPAGMATHALVGVAWSLFYAYFFWARFRKWPPALQGLAFAALPLVLATFLVYPQMQLMLLREDLAHLDWGSFLAAFRDGSIGGLVLGHALFGLTVGIIYTHPVGYRVDRPPKRPPSRHRSREKLHHARANPYGFIFATGIECSYPTIEHGRWRRDEMEATQHYERWHEDFDRAREVGITHIRYGPPLHLIFAGRGSYDWSWIDEPMRELRELGPEPIVDLCHFGLPGWLGNFQNPEIMAALAEYASAFAERYPWVRFYTPVNEMYVCARMSALDGVWNEQKRDESAFARAVFNLAGACVKMTKAILERRPDAALINSESSEFSQSCCPDDRIDEIAAFENERRFLPLDLIYSKEVSPMMRDYLREHGIGDDQYRPFMDSKPPRRSVIGLDYYEWNERLIDSEGKVESLGELFGWYVIASQYWDRYKRTLMHTETNRVDAGEASRWLWRQWHNVQLLRHSGVPLIGFTWYSLTDQIDWDRAIEAPLGIVSPVGLFDLNRDPREVGLSYAHLIDMHRDKPEYRECQAVKELLG
jgi:beta-glucosidase/6-phospho-beta-glucosidase/beta-galactosidase